MKRTLLTACLCTLCFFAKSQNCQPASNCSTAPILCGFYLHGLQGETLPFQSVETWAPFVCGTLENNTWLAFTPCETSVSLEIQVFSCIGAPGGAGMQAEIYQTEDCFAIIPIGFCLEQIFPGTSGVIEAFGLTPGEVYYLMLDGWNGDFCQYQINVLQGIDTSPPAQVDCSQGSPGYLAGDTLVACDTNGVKHGNYQIVPPSASAGGGGCPLPEFDCVDIQWNVPPGAFISSSNSSMTQVTIDFTNASSGIVSVEFVPNPQCTCFCADFCLPALPGDYEIFVTVLPAACDPITGAGTMNLAPMLLCEAEMASAAWNNDATLDGDDVLVFVLHTGSGNALGNVLAVNSTGVFGFDPGTMSFGQPYFISAAAGNELNGSVDFSDPNLSVAQGQPVVFFSNPTLDLSPPDTLTCDLPSTLLVALPGGGSGDFGFEWTLSGSYFSNLQNPAASIGGSYVCTSTDYQTGCTAAAAIFVQEDKMPPDLAAAGCELNCNVPACDLSASSATPGAVFTWTFPNGEQMVGASISTNISGEYLVSAAAPNGCISQANVEVTDASVLPDLYVTGSTIICDQPANLLASSNTPGVNFNWMLPDGTTVAGANIAAAEPGIYFVTATDPAGCENEAETIVGQGSASIKPFFEVKMPTCFGGEDGFIRLDSVSGGEPPFLFSPEFPLENLGAGEFQLSLTDANGCKSDTLILLQEPPPVTVKVNNDTTILAGESVELAFESNIVPAKINWQSSIGLTAENQAVWQVEPETEGTFWVVVEDSKGCAAADSLQIFLAATGQIFVPNVFTPNEDGQNDRLTIFTGKDVAQVRSFRIFDRWGELVFLAENFTPNDLAHGWDGKLKGKALDPAVFVFLAEIEMKNGEVNLISGDVTLVR